MSQVDISQYQVAPAVVEASLSSRSLLSKVSIIIPVGPEEVAWRSLMRDLAAVSDNAELLLVATDREPANFGQFVGQCGIRFSVRWLRTEAGRARQMNLGAARANRPFLWFLHADTRLRDDVLVALERSLTTQPDALHYFDLEFQNDGPVYTHWNALGVRFRSRCLGLPFGDQGLCLKRELFGSLGGFNEQVAYGEDHLLVWAARRHWIQLQPVGAALSTSARKYSAEGWLAVTMRHGWRTWRQAAPQWFKLLWSRFR